MVVPSDLTMMHGADLLIQHDHLGTVTFNQQILFIEQRDTSSI
jgi:hypothetical protein